MNSSTKSCNRWSPIIPPPHDLYKDGDLDIPEQVLDRNGQVALGMCKVCGRAECELTEPCVPREEN